MSRRSSASKSSVSFASSLIAPNCPPKRFINYIETDSDENSFDDLEKSSTSSSSSSTEAVASGALYTAAKSHGKQHEQTGRPRPDQQHLHHHQQQRHQHDHEHRQNVKHTNGKGELGVDFDKEPMASAAGGSTAAAAAEMTKNGFTHQAHKSASTAVAGTQSKAGDLIQDGKATSARKSAKANDDFNDEIDKLTKKLKNIEARLDRNDRRADQELRKLCLQRQKELNDLEWNLQGSVTDLGVHRSLPGLQRSSTDFVGPYHSDMYSSASAEDFGRGRKMKASKEPLTKTRSESANRKPSFGQRLQKSSSSVLRAATSTIPSLILPHLKSEKKSSQVYASMDSVSDVRRGGGAAAEEDMYPFASKARRSPLKAIGTFVDDKIFKGRLGSGNRSHSRSSLEVVGSGGATAGTSNDSSRSSSTARPCDRVLGPSCRQSNDSSHQQSHQEPPNPSQSSCLLHPSRVSCSDDVFDANRRSTVADVGPSRGEGRKLRAFSTPNSREIIEVLNRPLLLDEDEVDSAYSQSSLQSSASPESSTTNLRTQIRPEAMAEIEAFERLASDYLTTKSST